MSWNLTERLRGPVREAASRLIAGSFRRDGERLYEKRPRFSIPARPEEDDDLILIAALEEAAAALEAEASKRERRGLERAAKVAETWRQIEAASRRTIADHFAVSEDDMLVAVATADGIAEAIRALIPEAPVREGELEAAAKAIFEQKGLHLSTGKAWESAITADRYYCLQYAEAVLIAIGRLPPPPSQDREPNSQRGAK